MQSGDDISSLPVDQTPVDESEMQIFNTLFSSKDKPSFSREIKSILFMVILYVLFAQQFIDNFINKFIPISAKLPYMLVVIKALLFSVIFWVVNKTFIKKKE